MELDGPRRKGGQAAAAARAEAEAAAAGAAPLTRPQTEVAAAVAAQTALRREGQEAEEGTSYLVAVEGLPHRAWTEAGVEVRLWELSKVVEEERLSPWREGAGGLSCAGAGEEAVALP